MQKNRHLPSDIILKAYQTAYAQDKGCLPALSKMTTSVEHIW